MKSVFNPSIIIVGGQVAAQLVADFGEPAEETIDG
jgi:hypothetical protein